MNILIYTNWHILLPAIKLTYIALLQQYILHDTWIIKFYQTMVL